MNWVTMSCRGCTACRPRLPLFVPGLPHFVGTFGAIIRMRAPLTDRRALFDIGVAGPIAGFVVAVIALVIGLRLSTVVPIQTGYGMHLGEPLLLQFASWVVIGPLSPTADVILHPVARRRTCRLRPLGRSTTQCGGRPCADPDGIRLVGLEGVVRVGRARRHDGSGPSTSTESLSRTGGSPCAGRLARPADFCPDLLLGAVHLAVTDALSKMRMGTGR
jgi:hypothetical protein